MPSGSTPGLKTVSLSSNRNKKPKRGTT